MLDPAKVTAFFLADAYYGTCQVIHDFIGATVRPIVDRNTNVLPWCRVANGMITRVHGWMRSLGKLNHAGDSQAILAGSRALFELAVDFALIKHEENGSFAKLMLWQQSSKLKWARRVVKHDPQGHPDAATFIAREEQGILQERQRLWGHTKHPRNGRWTDRFLEDDAVKAESYEPTGFVEYHNVWYPQACWQVHGSGVIGLLETPPDMIPFFSARGYYDSALFAVASSKLVLKIFNQYNAVAEQQFSALELQIAQATFDVARRHNTLL